MKKPNPTTLILPALIIMSFLLLGCGGGQVDEAVAEAIAATETAQAAFDASVAEAIEATNAAEGPPPDGGPPTAEPIVPPAVDDICWL